MSTTSLRYGPFDCLKPAMRSHDEIKLHHEFIKTSLFYLSGGSDNDLLNKRLKPSKSF